MVDGRETNGLVVEQVKCNNSPNRNNKVERRIVGVSRLLVSRPREQQTDGHDDGERI